MSRIEGATRHHESAAPGRRAPERNEAGAGGGEPAEPRPQAVTDALAAIREVLVALAAAGHTGGRIPDGVPKDALDGVKLG